MQTITIDLPYDFSTGDLASDAVQTIAELHRLLPLGSVKHVEIAMESSSVRGEQLVVQRTTALPAIPETVEPFNWIAQLVDEVLDDQSHELEIDLIFRVEDDDAMLLKASWLSDLPRLTVETAK